MAGLRPLPYRVVKRKLEKAGFEEGLGKGSHRKFVKVHTEGIITAVVPYIAKLQWEHYEASYARRC